MLLAKILYWICQQAFLRNLHCVLLNNRRKFNVKYEKEEILLHIVIFVTSFKLALAVFPHDYYVRFNMIEK